jgi:hypothetical protein
MTDRIEQFWRDATAEDVARVMKGEKVEARFRDPSAGWRDWVWCAIDNSTLFLGGWKAGEWFDHEGDDWTQCQVYDPPQWWLDKPDPGEGYRLLEKFPDEPKLTTDEFFETFDNKWTQVGDTGSIQYHGVWYRRRIETNSPEKLESSVCASTIPKGWTTLSLDEPRLASDAYWSALIDSWVLIGDARLEYANSEKWPAIRRLGSFELVVGFNYILPSGKMLKVTQAGFEVF